MKKLDLLSSPAQVYMKVGCRYIPELQCYCNKGCKKGEIKSIVDEGTTDHHGMHKCS